MKKQLTVSIIAGVFLSAAALYLAFRNVPLTGLWRYLASINYMWVFPSLALVFAALVLRAIRWRYMLAPENLITVTDAFHPMMIGFMINCILPGRMGEIARPLALRQTQGVAFGTGFGTVAAERFFDLLFMAVMYIIMINAVQIDPELTIGFGDFRLSKSLLESLFNKTMVLGLILIVGLILVSVKTTRHWLATLAMAPNRLISGIAPRLSDLIGRYFSRPLVGLLDTMAGGLAQIKSPKKILICATLTTMVWSLEMLSYAVMAKGFPGMHLSMLEMSAYMIIILFFIALPSVPGWWGMWEAGGVFALSLFGVPQLEAAGFTLVNHALHVFPIILIGLASTMVTSISVWQVARTDTAPSHSNRRDE